MKKLLFLILFISPALYAQVPVTIAPVPYPQFFDSSGAPLANGCIFTYNAGSSTPAATYTDSSGTSQNTNPIILNGGGFSPSGIWLISQSYKFVVFSTGSSNCASGTQQWAIDNINPGPFLAGNNTWSGSNTFSGTTTFNGLFNTTAGGSLTGSFSGNPNFTGTPNFNNVNFNGLSYFNGILETQTVRGYTAASPLSIVAGSSTTEIGGEFDLTSGNGAVGLAGGPLILTGGTGQGGNGGNISILAGPDITNGAGGYVNIVGGNGGGTVAGGAGGAAQLVGGIGGLAQAGGQVLLESGLGGPTGGVAGNIVIQVHAPVTAGNPNGGIITLNAGGGYGTGIPGQIQLTPGVGGSGSGGGNVQINGGIAGGTGFQANRVNTGTITMMSGAPVVLTWKVPFLDTLYSPVCTVIDSGDFLTAYDITAMTTGTVTVYVVNSDSSDHVGTLSCMAAHD